MIIMHFLSMSLLGNIVSVYQHFIETPIMSSTKLGSAYLEKTTLINAKPTF
jgi:hypothetical protein